MVLMNFLCSALRNGLNVDFLYFLPSILLMCGFSTARVDQLCGTQRVLGVRSVPIYYVIMAVMISEP